MDSDLLTAITEAEVTLQARQHYAESSSYQAALRSKYETNHRWYNPPDGDQWPSDKLLRPGMIHVTANVIKPAVETEARLEALLPRVMNTPDGSDEETRSRAEAAEKLMLRFLELSGWDVWLTDLTKSKAIYGKAILKVFWNKEDARPDVVLIENPANLRVGWGTSDFRVMDWALYEYAISPTEAVRRWPDIVIKNPGGKKPLEVLRVGNHSDPLGQVGELPLTRPPAYLPSIYEGKQITCWDYWFKDEKGVIKNAVFANQTLVGTIQPHKYLPDLPYIVIEHSHEPGSPEGMALVDDLTDLQMEINRALSHWAQLVADEIDPAWQADVDSIPAGMVPRGGEILAVGEGHQIRPLEKPVNQFPIQSLIVELFREFHFVSGLSEILFALPPGAQTAGRALSIQIEASNNRLDPRRRRLYRGLFELLIFWQFMCEKVNPKIGVGSDGKKAGLRELVSGLRRWKFGAPEITPKDVQEATVNTISKVQAKLLSVEDGMDELGVDSPLEQIKKIMAERTNPALFAGDTQAYLAVWQLMQQMQLQQQAADAAQQQSVMGQGGDPNLPPGPGGPAGPGQGQGGPTPGQAANGQMRADAQAAQPILTPAMNEQGMSLPPTQVGSPAPVGGPPIANQTLIRAQPNGGALALQQIKLGGNG